MDTHLLPQWQDWPVILIFNGYLEIEKWVTELHEDLAESTVASIFATFTTIMNAVFRSRLIPANPCHGTWMIEDGIPEVARRARLGHKMKGIARAYDHVTPEMRQQVGLAGLSAADRARLESWFPHLRAPVAT